MFANFFWHFQVLLTPPDEGPRVKGQRIKLQDIVEGVYNPLSSNNGCWISCEWPFFPRQNIKWSAEIINFTHNFSWRVSLPESMGRDSFIVHREKLDDVGAHFDVKHNLCEYCRHGPVGRCWFSSSPSFLLSTSQRADPPELHQVFFDTHFFSCSCQAFFLRIRLFQQKFQFVYVLCCVCDGLKRRRGWPKSLFVASCRDSKGLEATSTRS